MHLRSRRRATGALLQCTPSASRSAWTRAAAKSSEVLLHRTNEWAASTCRQRRARLRAASRAKRARPVAAASQCRRGESNSQALMRATVSQTAAFTVSPHRRVCGRRRRGAADHQVARARMSGREVGAEGESRTPMPRGPRGLSSLRFPFRHPGRWSKFVMGAGRQSSEARTSLSADESGDSLACTCAGRRPSNWCTPQVSHRGGGSASTARSRQVTQVLLLHPMRRRRARRCALDAELGPPVERSEPGP